MKTFTITSFIFLIISLSSTAQSGWKTYTYDAHQFKIDFYEAPEFSVDTSMFMDQEQFTFFWDANITDTLHQNIHYAVNVATYPQDYIHSDSAFNVVEGFINSSQNSTKQDNEFTLLSSSLLEINGYPGKSFKWKNINNGVFFEYEVYLIESRLYILSVVCRAGENHNDFISRYFDSFIPINTPKGDFKLPELGFKRSLIIDFPAKPEEEVKTVDSEIGKLMLDLRTLEATNGDENMVYVAMETMYPFAMANESSEYEMNQLYYRSVEGSLKSTNSELISLNNISLGGKNGKEYKAYYKEGQFIMVYRLLYSDRSMYTFGVMTSPEKDGNKAMMNFFDTFKIAK